MIGSTIIAEADPSRLAGITSVDDLESFARVELDVMTTIDFVSFTTAGNVDWTEGEPIYFDEDDGLCIAKISDAGLSYLLAHAADLPDEHQGDVQKLAEFVQKNGPSGLYEVATF